MTFSGELYNNSGLSYPLFARVELDFYPNRAFLNYMGVVGSDIQLLAVTAAEPFNLTPGDRITLRGRYPVAS